MRAGVDVGGTFTDVVAVAADGIAVAKVPSTPQDQSVGVFTGLDRAGVDLGAAERFAHGTTVATNTVLERDGARTALVTTAGFRDLLTIGRQDRPSLYDLTARRPEPVVPGGRVVEAAERITVGGEVVAPLADGEVARVADAVAELQPEAVAVCLLFSFADDRHERALAEALAQRLGPDVPISRSGDVLPVFREYERASTTAANAYLAPRMQRYLERLEEGLAGRGLSVPLEVMRSGGGTFGAGLATRYPVHTLLSGPAGGAWGAAAVGAASGNPDVIAVDMGGTSTDVSLIEGGEPRTTAATEIGGLPVAVSTTDIHTVGAGGGSIAWADEGGALRVGPRSAGADPGPACYGRGGEQPTVTDANVVLGRLDPGAALGGELALDPGRARAAVARLGEQLGLAVVTTAAGIVRVAEAQMAKALRVVSVERGRDPRRFALVAFGGAGPLHQGPLARRLGVTRVLVPPRAGVLSALGLLATPVTVEEVRTHLADLAATDEPALDAAFGDLTGRAEEQMQRQGVTPDRLRRSADLRYAGQAFALTVAAGDGPAALAERFHATHEERYGWASHDEPVELVNLRVRAEGPRPDLPVVEVAEGGGADRARTGTQPVVVGDGRGEGDGENPRPLEADVYARDRLGAGDTFTGPAVVTGIDATCFVLPGQHVTVDPRGTLVIEEAKGEARRTDHQGAGEQREAA